MRKSSHLQKKKKLQSSIPASPSDSDGPTHDAHRKLRSLTVDSIAFRVLNALLNYAPTEKGISTIADDILVASEESDGLDQLADFYITGLLLPIKGGGNTPSVSYHPSRDAPIGFDAEREEICQDLESAKREPAKLRKYTLYRDGYRCVVSRIWDMTSHSEDRVLDMYKAAGDSDSDGPTEAAHILPFSLMSLFEKCTILSVIKSFANIESKELSGDNLNALTNVITLDTSIHKTFGNLRIWFEAVPGKENTYNIRKAHTRTLKDTVKNGAQITFMSPDSSKFPLPDPRYLALHAAVAKVVKSAGIAEYIDDKLRKYEAVRVLSDESGAEYLAGLLHIAQKRAVPG